MENIDEIVKNLEDGIICDYANDQFVFIVKDYWSKEELQLLKRNKGRISCSIKDGIAYFVVSINDCLECSDCSFTLNDENIKCLDKQNYSFQLYIYDENNTIVSSRQTNCSNDKNDLLSDLLSLLTLNDSDELIESKISIVSKMYEPFIIDETSPFFISI